MSFDRKNLPSVAYWRGQRQPQRFYIAFCLLMSSIQDALLGSKELATANLNWAATCSYYSLVHAGRLIVFVALGDFPRRHRDLQNLLSPSGHQTKNSGRPRRDGYPFDWLRKFTEDTKINFEARQAGTSPNGRNTLLDQRNSVVDYLQQIGITNSREQVDTFGRVIVAAAELRNDSNYEALLIAHEHSHDLMTPCFETLANRFGQATDTTLPFVVETFNSFVQNDQDLEQDRAAYYRFVREYLDARLLPGIRRKLCGFPELNTKLEKIVGGIDPPRSDVPYEHLEQEVSIDMFHGKRGLMDGFEMSIQALSRALRQVT